MRNLELWSTIAEGHEGILATVSPDATPHMTNVYYVIGPEDGCIRISTTSLRAQGKNARAHSRAALHVAGPDFFDFAVAECDVEVLEAAEVGDAGCAALHEIHSSLKGRVRERPTFDEQMITDHRIALFLTVTRVYGLAHRSTHR